MKKDDTPRARKPIRRRAFLKHSSAVAVGTAAAAWGFPVVQAAGANDRVVIGVAGCSRGKYVGKEFAKQNVHVKYVCDPDEARREAARREVKAELAVNDLRRIIDDPVVDVLVVATPDHWHAPATILACEAGKHVYVEKPCSHNIREGRLMIEAARRTGRIVQVGSQTRGTKLFQEAIQVLHEGAIGDILVAKAWNSQRRGAIGHSEPSDPPPGFDYHLWVGPAPMRPFRKNCHHYTWHWWYDFGTGDAGNDGVHELDVARWGLGANTHPVRVSGQGGKLYFDDDQQFPDTQYVVFEYAPDDAHPRPRVLIYEHRIWSPYVQDGLENGNAFYGTKGMMILGKGAGWRLYGPKNELIREEKGGNSVPQHVADFLDAIRTGNRPAADIEIGHGAATLAHLGNILARTGLGAFRFDAETERILDAPEADAFVQRTYREGHWAVPRGV
jgi:predicted dehydrogenase